MSPNPKEQRDRAAGAKTPNTMGDFVRNLVETVRRSFLKPGPVTFEGTVFIVLAFLIGLAATNTGTNLLYLIFSLMMAFLIVSGLLSSRTVKRLSVERSQPKHIVAGQPAEIRITLRNGKRLFGSYGLQVSDMLQDGTVAGYCYFLRVPAKSEVSVSYRCVFHRRGLYRFANVVVTTTYPFGLVRRSVVIPAEREVLVYPQVLPWERLGIPTPPDLGERESRRKGPGISLYGIREQEPSEGSRWVHWKKTAQLDRLMRREFEAEEKKNVCLVLDNAIAPLDDPKTLEAFERVVVLVASVAHHLLVLDYQVELVTRSGCVRYNSGPHQRYRILRALALLEPLLFSADTKLLRGGTGGDTATLVFRCEGQGPVGIYPDGAQVYTDAGLVGVAG